MIGRRPLSALSSNDLARIKNTAKNDGWDESIGPKPDYWDTMGQNERNQYLRTTTTVATIPNQRVHVRTPTKTSIKTPTKTPTKLSKKVNKSLKRLGGKSRRKSFRRK